MSTAGVIESERSAGKPELRTVTVRMPAELHEGLKRLAHRRECSMNRFCVEGLALVVRVQARRQSAADGKIVTD